MDSIQIFLIGVAVIHLVLVIFALRDLFTIAQFILIGKIIWFMVIVFIVVTGPLIYMHYGRGERSWNNKIREFQQHMIEEHSANNESTKE